MRTTNLLVAATSLLFLSINVNACLTMSVNANRNSKRLFGALIDDGETKCIIDTNLDSPGRDNQYWFKCVNGYAAWLSKDLITLAYGHDGENFRLGTKDNGKTISASGYC